MALKVKNQGQMYQNLITNQSA